MAKGAATAAKFSRAGCSVVVLASGGGEVHPHEEVAVAAVAELLVVDDVAAVLDQEPRDGVDDARGLGAVEGEYVLDRRRGGVGGRVGGGRGGSRDISHGVSIR